MPHWRHRRASVFTTALFALRIPTGNAAASWAIINPESSGRHSAFSLQTRGTSDVVKDKYFIPAIASMGTVLLLSFVCCYCLGWCFNRRRMQKFYSRTAYPASSTFYLDVCDLLPCLKFFSSTGTLSHCQTDRKWYRRWRIER
jgi:hypothetical protein